MNWLKTKIKLNKFKFSSFGCTYNNVFSQTYSGINDPFACFKLCDSSYNFFFLYSPPNLPFYCVCSSIKNNIYPPAVLDDNMHQVCNKACNSTCSGAACSYCGSFDGSYASAFSICN